MGGVPSYKYTPAVEAIATQLNVKEPLTPTGVLGAPTVNNCCNTGLTCL